MTTAVAPILLDDSILDAEIPCGSLWGCDHTAELRFVGSCCPQQTQRLRPVSAPFLCVEHFRLFGKRNPGMGVCQYCGKIARHIEFRIYKPII